MAEAFRAFGLDPARIDEAAYPAGGLLGYLEVHIEQGPVLETLRSTGRGRRGDRGTEPDLGRARGRAGHAGTTPMARRLDALAAAAELVLEVERLARSIDGLTATVGALTVEPGASNVVPGRVRFSVDVRHVQDHVRVAAVDELFARATALAERRGVEFRGGGARAPRRGPGRSASDRLARRGTCRRPATTHIA